MVTVKVVITEGLWTPRRSVDRLRGVLEPPEILYKYLCVSAFLEGGLLLESQSSSMIQIKKDLGSKYAGYLLALRSPMIKSFPLTLILNLPGHQSCLRVRASATPFRTVASLTSGFHSSGLLRRKKKSQGNG